MYDYNYTVATRVIEDLKAIPGDADDLFDRVTEAVRGIGAATFMALDEKPGYFSSRPYDEDWHWKLRRTRNSGPDGFFDAIREES